MPRFISSFTWAPLPPFAACAQDQESSVLLGLSVFPAGALRYGLQRPAVNDRGAGLGLRASLGADGQCLADPVRNQDRGPASSYALRLHRES